MDGVKLGVFEGRAAYEEALRSVLIALCAQGSREIFCIADDFVDWPWSDVAVVEALTQWARRGRTLHLMGKGFENMRERHPRFVRWRTTYDHCVDAREHEVESMDSRTPKAGVFEAGGPERLSLRLFDEGHYRGAVNVDAGDALRLQEWFDVLLQRSGSAFPASTLGL
ncbi:hypothetical protein ACFJGW_13835 [Burkholderiaceae bacterium UC74_6]